MFSKQKQSSQLFDIQKNNENPNSKINDPTTKKEECKNNQIN